MGVAYDFLSQHFKACPSGYVCIWSLPTKKSYFFHVDQITRAAQRAEELDASGEDVYFGTCPLKNVPQSGRGTHKDVTSVPAIWLDLDIAQADKSAHKALNLPSMSDVESLLGDLPVPTGEVDSGHGLHVYWYLDEAVTPEIGGKLCKDLQEYVIKQGARLGFHVDYTADLARVLRVPGTHNKKDPNDIKPVNILTCPTRGDDYKTVDFSMLLNKSPARSSAIPASLAERARLSAEGTKSPLESSALSPSLPSTDLDISHAIDLETLKKRLKRVKSENNIKLADAILSGESIAPPGQRDKAMSQACGMIAHAAGGHTPGDVLVEIFRPMLTKWASEPGAALTLGQEMVKAIDKLDRSSLHKRECERDELIEAQKFNSQNILSARSLGSTTKIDATSPAPTAAYTTEEWASFAAKHDVSPDTLIRRQIIKHDKINHVLVNGVYQTEVCDTNLVASVNRDLAPAPVELYVTTQRSHRPKNLQELIIDYGQVARHYVHTLTADRSYYDDKTQTFYKCISRRADLQAVYHPEIDAWLDHLGGSQASKLKDWVATVTDLSRASCALILSGPAGSGKSLLPLGLARLYHRGGPTELLDIIKGFNSLILKCPLICADEELPRVQNRPVSSGYLRALISSDSRTINAKNRAEVPVAGNIRLVISVNNPDAIFVGDKDDTADADAFAARFLHIQVDDMPSQYINALGGRSGRMRDWVDGDLIAQHALWLKDNRIVQAGKRFLVEGDAHAMADRLNSNSEVGSMIHEWIAKYLADPTSHVPGIVVGDGRVLVNAQSLSASWDSYITYTKVPYTKILERRLRGLGDTHDHLNGKQKKVGTSRLRYTSIKISGLLQSAEDMQIGDIEQIKERINKVIPVVEEKE